MENKKYLIYCSLNSDFDEIKAEMLEVSPKYVEVLTESEINNRVCDIMMEDKQLNFDESLSMLNIDTNNKLIVYGDIQLWNGVVFGIKILNDNFKSALNGINHDNFELYVDLDNGELKGINEHHDGTDYLIFRELRKNADIDEIEKLATLGKLSHDDMDKYTKKTSVKIIKELTNGEYKENNKKQECNTNNNVTNFPTKKKII